MSARAQGCCLPRQLAGSWIGSGTTGAQTDAHMKCWCHGQRFSVLHHSISPYFMCFIELSNYGMARSPGMLRRTNECCVCGFITCADLRSHHHGQGMEQLLQGHLPLTKPTRASWGRALGSESPASASASQLRCNFARRNTCVPGGVAVACACLSALLLATA